METQSNTQTGPIVVATTADLTGKEGYLCKPVNNGGKLAVALPAAATDHCPYLILRVNSAVEVEVVPFTPDKNHRVRLNGVVNPGGTLVLATGGDAGKVVAGATGEIVALAEEIGVDEQLLLVRPFRKTVAAP